MTNPFTANGNYDILDIVPGAEYLCVLNGTFGGATVTLQYKDGITGDYRAVSDGAFTAAAEFTFILPSDELRFVVTNVTTTSISVSLVKLV